RGIYCGAGGFTASEENPVDFYTLGVATYIDGISDIQYYYDYIKDQNPVFKDYFGWLYDAVVYSLWDVIGECQLADFLAYPGFHIFGTKPNEPPKMATKMYMEQPSATIHVDLQHEQHDFLWSHFKEVDLENTLSFTLPIQVPMNGGGLNTWEEESMKQYEIDNEYTKHMKELDYSKWGDYDEPTVVPYTAGEMFYFIGSLVHQIAPAYNADFNDRRLSLQGHGVKCDGVWQLYF
ncbi:MAG: hypothetical protein CMG34_02060, partial [Candidatus Marinimicrobia bacterium]|nr:hypothetical protein [Candidatus Neomarinimicrobiota bacterium]